MSDSMIAEDSDKSGRLPIIAFFGRDRDGIETKRPVIVGRNRILAAEMGDESPYQQAGSDQG
jgi:hypothetical protein